jgi:putative oxidoreductase
LSKLLTFGSETPIYKINYTLASMTLSSLQKKLADFGSGLQSPLLLVIRLFWGWSFLVTGMGKFFHMQNVILYFHSLGIPIAPVSVFLTALIEVVGGTLLMLGLFSRLASIPLIFIMVMAFLTAEIGAVRMIFSNPQNFIHRDPFSFLFASVLILVFGPGKISLDWLLERKS